MKQEINLFDILQNSAIGVIAIHSFILGYNNVAKNKNNKTDNPNIKLLFYVLPLMYDLKAMISIRKELYTTISNNKEITLGLQDRANKMSIQTFESLNLGLSKKIFNIDNENFIISINEDYAKEILSYIKINDSYYRDIQIHAKRLGNIFAKKDDKMLQIELNIRF